MNISTSDNVRTVRNGPSYRRTPSHRIGRAGFAHSARKWEAIRATIHTMPRSEAIGLAWFVLIVVQVPLWACVLGG